MNGDVKKINRKWLEGSEKALLKEKHEGRGQNRRISTKRPGILLPFPP
jgi:hypothetical protein